MKEKVKLVTHNGYFHADDVFATATLLLMLGDKESEIIRTRDKDVINEGDFVYDVGSVYDQENNKFDHHQEGFDEKRKNGIPYASFGLIWKKFGEEICGSEEVSNELDRKIVQSIDAIDNGVEVYEAIHPEIYPFTMVDFVDHFNSSWKEKNSDDLFIEAVSIAKKILSRVISRVKDKKETEPIIEKIYNETEDKRLIVLDKNHPWEEVLIKYPEPLFVVKIKEDGQWSIKSVKDKLPSFNYRKYFPESWAGKQGQELAEITGVEDALFCHNARFVCSAKSKEGAIALAKLALEK